MKVYHISSAPINGGAARAGLRLHRGLVQMDCMESLWLDAGGCPDAPGTMHLADPVGCAPLLTRISRSRWRRKIQNGFARARTPYSNPLGWGNSSSFHKLARPDVWNLHWVADYLDWEHLLPWLAEQAPIIWTLHDLNPLMGIWHYVPLERDLNAERRVLEDRALAFKQKALSCIPKDRLTFVGPSKWMVQCCRESPVTSGFPVVHIPYGLDTEVFSPREKQIVRCMFDIPDDVFVVGFLADAINDPRKGMQQLDAAILALPDSNKVRVLTVGKGHSPKFKFLHHHLGPIQSDHLLSFFYSACDLFICPSLQDNLPNTVLESMSCGTPVVAYETGGLPDMVRQGKTGFVVKPVGDATALSNAINNQLSEFVRRTELRSRARKSAVSNYSLSVQAGRYRDLYEEVTKYRTKSEAKLAP